MNDNEFYHYGVLGMKWGRRRNSSSSISNRQAFKNAKQAGKEARKASIAESRKTEKGFGSAARASKKAKQAKIEARMESIAKDKQYNKDLKNAKKNSNQSSKKDPVKKMSDAELRNKINRLNMEKQYSQLTSKQKSAGKKFVSAVLVGSATAVASSYTQKYMNKGISFLGEQFSKRVIR